MKTKTIPCPVCDGRGYVLWTSATDQSCSTGSKVCPHCQGAGNREVPQTNADRIRAVSDEELAAWMARKTLDIMRSTLKVVGARWDESPELEGVVKKDNLDWLRQPVKDGEGDG